MKRDLKGEGDRVGVQVRVKEKKRGFGLGLGLGLRVGSMKRDIITSEASRMKETYPTPNP